MTSQVCHQSLGSLLPHHPHCIYTPPPTLHLHPTTHTASTPHHPHCIYTPPPTLHLHPTTHTASTPHHPHCIYTPPPTLHLHPTTHTCPLLATHPHTSTIRLSTLGLTHTVYLGCPMFHRRVAAARVTRLHNTTSTCCTTGAPSPRDETDEESRSCRQNPRA